MSTPTEHSSLGPSSWEGFVRCPGKPNAEAGLEDTSGREAAEGTVFHNMVSMCLDFGLEPSDFLGRIQKQGEFEIEVDHEMVRSAAKGLEYVRGFQQNEDCKVFVETRVDISDWTLPGQFGTADVIIVNEMERSVICMDWKYGRVPVYAEGNYQAQGYVLGAWKTIFGEMFEWDPVGVGVTVVIEQPRVEDAGGQWTTSMEDVLKFGEHVREQAILSQDPNAPRVPGDKQCRYCRAAGDCAALAGWRLGQINLHFDDLDIAQITGEPLAMPVSVTPEHRTILLEAYPGIKKWFDKLHAAAFRDATVGKPTPGLKLVEGRRPARQVLEDSIGKYEQALMAAIAAGQHKNPKTGELYAAYSDPKVLSPAVAEEIVGEDVYKKQLSEFVDYGKPKMILVPTSDPRPQIASAVDDLVLGDL